MAAVLTATSRGSSMPARVFDRRIRFRYPKTSERARGSTDEDRLAGAAHVGHFRVQRGHDRGARPRSVRRARRRRSRSPTTPGCWSRASCRAPAQRRMLDATLVAIAEHGLVPSVAASRMTLAAAPEALQGAVAAGILGCGSVILGSADSAARLFAAILARAASEPLEAAARARARRDARGAPAGAGLRPSACTSARTRAWRACSRSPPKPAIAGRHIEVARTWSSAWCREIWGKPLAMNVSGAIAAVLLDAGYPLLAHQGRADAGAHREPHRAPARGAAAPHRIRARRFAAPRPSTTTAGAPTASCRAKAER